jgi:hypothetical protein
MWDLPKIVGWGSLLAGPCPPLHELPPTSSNARRPVGLGESRADVASWRVLASQSWRPLRILTVLTEKRDDRRAKPFGGGALASPANPANASAPARTASGSNDATSGGCGPSAASTTQP